MITKQHLIAEITEAFKDVELGNGIGLSEANAIDDYREESVRQECRKRDEKYNWSAIPVSALNQYNSSLSFFDAGGMRFHLPAFMIAVINKEYDFDITFTLTNLSDHSKSQLELLSARQRQVIKLFLEYIAEDPDYEFEKPTIKSAIEKYWSG